MVSYGKKNPCSMLACPLTSKTKKQKANTKDAKCLKIMISICTHNFISTCVF